MISTQQEYENSIIEVLRQNHLIEDEEELSIRTCARGYYDV